MRKLFRNIVIPSLLYECKAWYAGLMKFTKRPKAGRELISVRIGSLHVIVHLAMNKMARAVILVCKTTPVATLCVDSDLPPTEVAVTQYRINTDSILYAGCSR